MNYPKEPNMSAINIANFDSKKITLKAAPRGKYGSIYYLQYDGGYFPNITLPNMKVASCKAASATEESQGHKLFLTFEGTERQDSYGQKLREARVKLEEISETVKALLKKEAEQPTGKGVFYKTKFDSDAFDKNYRPLVWESEDEKTGAKKDLFSLKLQRAKDGDKITNKFRGMKGVDFLVDSKNDAMEVTTETISNVLTRGSVIKPVIQGQYVFVAGKDYTMYSTWTLTMARVVHQAVKQSFKLEEDNDGAEGLAPALNKLGLDDLKVDAVKTVPEMFDEEDADYNEATA